jgi:two-component system nitrogen regulation sensor histidine kinase NtrY
MFLAMQVLDRFNTYQQSGNKVPRSKTRRIGYEARIALTAMMAGFPAVLISLILLWTGGCSSKVIWTLAILILACWLGFSSAIRTEVALPLQTISNVLESLREGDFSLRARGAGNSDALGEVVMEVNALGTTLKGSGW